MAHDTAAKLAQITQGYFGKEEILAQNTQDMFEQLITKVNRLETSVKSLSQRLESIEHLYSAKAEGVPS